jgi:hypothetical protein
MPATGQQARRAARAPGSASHRRVFPARFKLRILEEYDQLDRAGKSALLEREQLRPSLISQWRAQRDAAALLAMDAEPGGQPRWPIHVSDSVRAAFTQTAAAMGYSPGRLIRVVMRYYAGFSDVLPARPGPGQALPAGEDASGPGTSAGAPTA